MEIENQVLISHSQNSIGRVYDVDRIAWFLHITDVTDARLCITFRIPGLKYPDSGLQEVLLSSGLPLLSLLPQILELSNVTRNYSSNAEWQMHMTPYNLKKITCTRTQINGQRAWRIKMSLVKWVCGFNDHMLPSSSRLWQWWQCFKAYRWFQDSPYPKTCTKGGERGNEGIS